MFKILIYGFFGIGNAGNEAMLRAFIEPIREHFEGDVEFIVANRHPSKAYDDCYGVRSIQNLEYSSRDKARGRWLRGLNPDDSPEFMALVREIAASDLVIVGPGQFLVETGEYGLFQGSLAQMATVVTACLLTHTPCYGLALACEPLSSPWSKLVIDLILPSLSYLTFRDSQSIDNLQAAGIQIPRYEVLGDLALVSEASNATLGRAVLNAEDIPLRSGPRLAVALRNIYWLGIDQDELRRCLANVLSSWLSHPDRDVLMISQNVYIIDSERDNDRVAARKVVELLPQRLQERVHEVTGEYDPATIEALYGECDVTLSARLHGAVFSCKQGTPPVALTFMDKTRGFFKRIRHPECMVDLEAPAEEIAAKLEDFLARRSELSKAILADVNHVRVTARRYSQIAIELLRQEPHPRRAWVRQALAYQTEPGLPTNNGSHDL